MDRVKLFKVEYCFAIKGRGTILMPDFSLPNNWQNHTESVIVATPDGQRFSATAQFCMTRVNTVDSQAPLDCRLRVTTLVTDRSKEEIPVDSTIFVSPKLQETLSGDKST